MLALLPLMTQLCSESQYLSPRAAAGLLPYLPLLSPSLLWTVCHEDGPRSFSVSFLFDFQLFNLGPVQIFCVAYYIFLVPKDVSSLLCISFSRVSTLVS